MYILLSEEARREARLWGEAIDRQIAEETRCENCGSTMHYESIRTQSNYRAFAVCNNPQCGNRYEF